MSFDEHSSVSPSSTMKKEKASMSKKDLKIALVAKRLSMLQDDHETHSVLLHPENPGQSESHKRGRGTSDDESSDDRQLMVWIPPQETVSQRVDLRDPLSTGGKLSSMKRAEELQANLSAQYPSFVKLMLKSHVSGCFCLSLPKKFCNEHLPTCDSTVVLVDEAGKESSTKYLVAKSGLSAGWRGFSIDHDLLEGDALVFQLIGPTKFQIYIVKEQTLGEVDGDLTLDPSVGQQKSVCNHLNKEDHSQKVLQTEDNYPFADYLSQCHSDVDLGSEVLDGIRFSDSDIKFEGVKGFEDFNIIVDGLILDSKFPVNTRKKYYELCHSQKSFLHENFLKGMNCNLVVGIISETINIADAINSCKKASTSHEDLRTWEKTLKGFELLGMNVAFLLARINQVLDPGEESDTADESNKLKESIIKRAFTGERMKALESKLKMLKETMEKIDFQMDAEITMASAWKQDNRRLKVNEIPAV